MKRREFIALFGSLAIARPAHAQPTEKLPTIGLLGSGTPSSWSHYVAAFVQRLRQLDWIEGRTVAIEYRWAEGRSERYAEIAAELVRLNVDVIMTSGAAAVAAAKQATSIIPIVFGAAADPVENGLVVSLARPGGNVTGLSVLQADLAGKRVELLREAVPGLRRLAVLANSGSAGAMQDMREVIATAHSLGLDPTTLEIQRAADIGPAIASLDGRAQALYICGDPFMNANRVRVITFALTARLPTMHDQRDFLEAGGLMCYGPNFPDLFRRAAEFIDRILRGAKPVDIPVEQPTKFDLIINLTTAKALGLTVPESLLLRADEVIE
jgi:putative ABC transport system substrate-binding protein